MNDSFDQIRDLIIKKVRDSKFIEDWFYAGHLLEVERQANWLCNSYPDANREAVLLSVWLHDIGRIEKGIDDGHEGYAYTRALEMLPEYGYDGTLVKLVAKACQTHRVDSGIVPESLEGKILATADALSHFYNNAYIRIFEHYRKTKSFNESIEVVRQKIIRDFEKKLFFQEAKDKVEDLYKAWLIIFKK